MREDTPAECTTCGACCFSMLERYVEVKGRDYAQLGDAAERLVHFIGNRAYMRIIDGHCAALAVDAENRRFLCAVYDDRPAICRDLERGSPACMGERDTKRERPLLSIARKARGGGLTVAAEAELDREGGRTTPTSGTDDVEATLCNRDSTIFRSREPSAR